MLRVRVTCTLLLGLVVLRTPILLVTRKPRVASSKTRLVRFECSYTVPQKDGVSRERRRGAEAHSYGGLVRSRFGEAVSTSRRTNFRAQFDDLL